MRMRLADSLSLSNSMVEATDAGVHLLGRAMMHLMEITSLIPRYKRIGAELEANRIRVSIHNVDDRKL